MNCMARAVLKAAVGVVAMTAAAGVWAQVQTYARGEFVWTDTNGAVAGLTTCTTCHNGAIVDLAGLRVRFAALNQAQTRARIETAMNVGGVPQMTGLYGALLNDDRESLAIFLGNIIGLPTTSASPLLDAMTAAVGATGQSTLTITNSGKASLTVSALAFSGANSTEFTRGTPPGNSCVAIPVNAGGTCQERINFTPAAGATGTRTATLTITHNGSPTTTVLALSGTVGAAPPPPASGGLPAGGGGGGGALWPWALLLMAAAAFSRRRPR